MQRLLTNLLVDPPVGDRDSEDVPEGSGSLKRELVLDAMWTQMRQEALGAVEHER